MSKFSFSNFNKERIFTFDTAAIQGNYTTLEELYNATVPDYKFQLKGVYVSTKSDYNDESPIIALANTYVNMPQHQLIDIKNMLADKGAIQAINNGEAGFTIRHYVKNLKKKNGNYEPKDCYSAEWCDVNPEDYEDEATE